MTAYHEGGHALVAMMTEGANRIHKATIMPRGSALGFVSQVPTRVAAALRMPIPHGMVPCKTWFVGITSGGSNHVHWMPHDSGGSNG